MRKVAPLQYQVVALEEPHINMDVADTFETSIRIYQTTRRHNPEERNLDTAGRISNITVFLLLC
jgi:hypothetical protein